MIILGVVLISASFWIVSRCMTPKLKAQPQPLRRFECIEAIVRRVAGL